MLLLLLFISIVVLVIVIIHSRLLSAPDCKYAILISVTISKTYFFTITLTRLLQIFVVNYLLYANFFFYIDDFKLKTLYFTHRRPTIGYGSALRAMHSNHIIVIIIIILKLMSYCHYKTIKALMPCPNNVVLESYEDRLVVNDLVRCFSISYT